jgi:DNA-binding protein YbaB
MNYKCLRCGYKDNQICNIKRHINRKKTCEPIFSECSTEECLLFLKTSDKNYGVDILMKEIEKLKKTISVYSGDKCNIVKGDINGNNNNNIYNIEIKVNSFEKTDYNVLKDNIHTCVKDGKVDEAKLIKLLHFNKDHPENHNIKVVNKRENRIQVFNGENFEESEYQGKEGLWKLGQDTLKKTEEQQLLDEEYLTNSIDDIDLNHVTLKEKRDRTSKIQTTLYNGGSVLK